MGAACAIDLTELDETDCLHAPAGPLAEAQRLAAASWGATESHFLINGSTVGIQAMVMAACSPGEPLALSRASHLSALAGVILAGARPIFAGTSWDAEWQLPRMPDRADVMAVLDAHPDLAAALLTRPDYFGQAAELTAIADVLHERDALLLVDEAHGAHLGMDPRQPAGALAAGADVVVQSTHKLLAAFTQASMLHHGPRADGVRLRRMLRLLQSTSPSFLLLGSLDAARRQRDAHGSADWGAATDLVQAARSALAAHGIATLGPDHGPKASWDPAKLMVDLAGTGQSGFGVADDLHDRAGIQVEVATPRYVGMIVGPGHRPADLDRLIAGILQALRQPATIAPRALEVPPDPPMVELPRDAFLGASRTVALESAAGEVAAELVCPYPPGLPALVPGERITGEVLEYLHALRSLGADFVGPEAPGLETLQVCARPSRSTR